MTQETYRLQIPTGYHPKMSLFETERAIKELKDYFQRELAGELNLTRVSAPLFVLPETGLNDNLNGVERPVSFDIREMGGRVAEVVHSLAKWKRYALKRYGIPEECGLYTDMNAVRRDEIPDNLHSFYVDQWDWERVITREERSERYLKDTVRRIYGVFLRAQEHIAALYPQLDRYLPEKIHFVTTQELEDLYPDLTPLRAGDAGGQGIRRGVPDADRGQAAVGPPPRRAGSRLRRLDPQRRYLLLLSRAGPGVRDILHGHPRGRSCAGRPAG